MPKSSGDQFRKKLEDIFYLNNFAIGGCRKCSKEAYILTSTSTCLECHCREVFPRFDESWVGIIDAFLESKKEMMAKEVIEGELKDEEVGMLEQEYQALLAQFQARSRDTIKNFFAGRVDYVKDKMQFEGIPRSTVDGMMRAKFGISAGAGLFETLLKDFKIAFRVVTDVYFSAGGG